ncbi:putative ABC transporter permease [Fredinandcohnia humi]
MLHSLLNGFDIYKPSLLTVDGVMVVLFYFTVYSFLGWLLENSYNYLKKGVFLKPNFFLGPFKPMYGFAPLLLIYLIGKDMHWSLVLLLCFLIPTLVEYGSGLLLEKSFGRKWWDYSDQPFQIQGHICLTFSVYWVLLTLYSLTYIHPAIVAMYNMIAPVWVLIWPTVALYLLGEFIFAVKRHLPQAVIDGESTKLIE